MKIRNLLTYKTILDISDDRVLGEALEWAVLKGIDFTDADFRDLTIKNSYLAYGKFSGADFSYTNLESSNLVNSNLFNAKFLYANLSCVDMYQADLRYANFNKSKIHRTRLGGSNLQRSSFKNATISNSQLDDDDCVIQIGPIGSRSDYLVAFMSKPEAYIQTGCFFGTIDEFQGAVLRRHKNKQFSKEYQIVIEMIKARMNLSLEMK